MLTEEQSQELQHHELLGEVGVGFDSNDVGTVAAHFREEGTDKLRYQ